MKTGKSKTAKPTDKMAPSGATYRRQKKGAPEARQELSDLSKDRFPKGIVSILVQIPSSLSARIFNSAAINGKSPEEYVIQAVTTMVESDEGTIIVNPLDLKQADNDERQFKRLKKEGFVLLGQYHKNCGLIKVFPLQV